MVLVEKTFGRELLLALLQQGHERTSPCRAHEVGDELIVGAALIDGQPAFGDDFKAFLWLEGQTLHRSLPHHRVQDRLVVLDVSIHVARPRNGDAAKLASHPDMVKGGLDGPLELAGEFGDRELSDIGRRRLTHCSQSSLLRPANP